MKRVLSILTIALVLFCAMPLENVFATSVDDVPSLETIDSASASALFETIKRLGYSFTEIPGNASDSFMNIMRPLVDSLVNDGYRLEDAFGRVGNRLYYSAEKVVEWVKHLFGSSNEGSFSFSSITFDPSVYNARVAYFVNNGYNIPSNLGELYNYPLFRGYFLDNDDALFIPVVLNTASNAMVFDTIYLDSVNYSVSGSTYSFVAGLMYYEVRYYNSKLNTFFVPSGYSYPYCGFSLYSGHSPMQYGFRFETTAVSLNDAIQKYLAFLTTCVRGVTIYPKINGVTYEVKQDAYTIYRPSAPSVQPSGYYPVDYDYVVNNFNEGDTIYENNVVNNNTTNNNTTNINPVFDIDFEDTFDFGLPDILDNINELPGYLTRSAIGISNHVGGDSPGGGLMGTIFNGIPIEISTVLIACFVLLCVFGLLNRLLG